MSNVTVYTNDALRAAALRWYGAPDSGASAGCFQRVWYALLVSSAATSRLSEVRDTFARHAACDPRDWRSFVERLEADSAQADQRTSSRGGAITRRGDHDLPPRVHASAPVK
jgi:hypothetical protein